MRKLFIFDMDGTLLPHTTANLEISRINNTEPKLMALENDFSHKVINSKEFAAQLYQYWGILKYDLVKKAFGSTPKLKNIRMVTNHISGNNDISCIITTAPNFFADFFYDYGFDYIFASEFPKNKLESLDLNRIIEPIHKPELARNLCKKQSLNFKDSFAFGDSMSDRYLFELLENTISVNGDSHIQSLAKFIYQGEDLWEAYNVLMAGINNGDKCKR